MPTHFIKIIMFLKEHKELLQPSTKKERRRHEVLEDITENGSHPTPQSEVRRYRTREGRRTERKRKPSTEEGES